MSLNKFLLLHFMIFAIICPSNADEISVGFHLTCEENQNCIKDIILKDMEEIYIYKNPEITLDDIEFAQIDEDEKQKSISKEGYLEDKLDNNHRELTIYFNEEGSKKFADLTSKNTGKRLAIVINGTIVCAPMINEAITHGQAKIAGNFSLAEAETIVKNINEFRKIKEPARLKYR